MRLPQRRGWSTRLAVLAAVVLAGLAAAVPGGALAAERAAAGPRAMGQGDGPAGALALATVRRMTLEEKVGQLFTTYVYGQTADDTDPANVAANRKVHGVDTARQAIERYHFGGIIYFAWTNNLQNPRQVAGLSNGLQRVAMHGRLPIPLLVATDQENGVVARMPDPATQLPGAMALGAARDPALARRAAEITGRELAAVGINQNFSPVADVNVNPQNPVIGVRSFGSDPALVSSLVPAQVRAYQRRVAATAKHFPGHGDTDVDSHFGLPIINHTREQLDQIDLPPFRAAIAAGVEAIMTAHIVVPALDGSGLPATLSQPILTGLLRQQLGYDGVVVTDALDMQGAQPYGPDSPRRVPVEALKAGADMLLMPPDTAVAVGAVLDAVRAGELPEARIDQSVYRILRLKLRRGLFPNPYVDPDRAATVVGSPAHVAAAGAIADRTVTLVRNEGALLPLRAGGTALIAGWDATSAATLAGELGTRGLATEALTTGANPDQAMIDRAVAAAAGKDLVVAATNRAWTTANAGQQRLVRALEATGTPVVVVATRDPYDIAHFPEVDAYLASYGQRQAALQAVARVLTGEVDPSGRLPVSIPAAGDPGITLYPFGHGLSYGTG